MNAIQQPPSCGSNTIHACHNSFIAIRKQPDVPNNPTGTLTLSAVDAVIAKIAAAASDTGSPASSQPLVGGQATGGRNEAVELATRAAVLLQKITQHAQEEVGCWANFCHASLSQRSEGSVLFRNWGAAEPPSLLLDRRMMNRRAFSASRETQSWCAPLTNRAAP